MSNYVSLTHKQRDELDRMRFFRNMWGEREHDDPKKWFMPETRRGGSVDDCEVLVKYGFAESNHSEFNPKGFIGRLFKAVFMPKGVVYRYAITDEGLKYANKYIQNLNP